MIKKNNAWLFIETHTLIRQIHSWFTWNHWPRSSTLNRQALSLSAASQNASIKHDYRSHRSAWWWQVSNFLWQMLRQWVLILLYRYCRRWLLNQNKPCLGSIASTEAQMKLAWRSQQNYSCWTPAHCWCRKYSDSHRTVVVCVHAFWWWKGREKWRNMHTWRGSARVRKESTKYASEFFVNLSKY